jgi:dTDP-glucose pyrophosphorylase
MRTDIEKFCISPSCDLKTALASLRTSGEKIVFVVDERKRLLGTLTDGDVRNWILEGGELNAKIDNVYYHFPYTVGVDYDMQKVRETMLEMKFNGIPVIDGGRVLVGLLFWQDVFGGRQQIEKPALNVPVVIMAGGKGTRLDPFTRILPKPLIPIGEKTVLETIISRFIPYNVRHYYITVNHKAKIIKSYFEELRPDYELTFVDEKMPQGTAGSLQYLRGSLSGDFIVTNCDIIIDTDYNEVLAYHIKQGNAITIVGSLKHIKIPYGVCDVGKGGRLKSISEKPEHNVLVNTGMYVISSELLDYIPADGMYHMTNLVDDAMKNGRKVGVFPIDETAWFDTGEWEEYDKTLRRLEL